jgi:ABC-type transport system substrate-binding protein
MDKAKELFAASGLSGRRDERLEDAGVRNDEPGVVISQIVQNALAEAGINIERDVRQGAEYTDAAVGGDFWATFGAVGNAQKFPVAHGYQLDLPHRQKPGAEGPATVPGLCRGDRQGERHFRS